MTTSLSNCSAPATEPYVPPAGWPCRCWLSARTSTSFTSDDLPLPLTPVTAANTPTGKSTVIPVMLLIFAFLSLSQPRGLRRFAGIAMNCRPLRYAAVSES